MMVHAQRADFVETPDSGGTSVVDHSYCALGAIIFINNLQARS